MSFEDDDIFACVDGLALNPSPNSLGSTPIEFSGVDGCPVPSAVPIAAPSSNGYICPECKKSLKTKSGFTRHLFLHKMNEYNARKPIEEEIKSCLPSLFECVLADIKAEPAIGEIGVKKRSFVEVLLRQLPSSNSADFVSGFSVHIIDCVLTRSKVMPSAQYEAALRSLNNLLANCEFCKSVLQNLFLCVPEDERNISEEVGLRLIWRISSLLMQKIQEAVFQHMQKTSARAEIVSAAQMSERELEAFKAHIGSILRAMYRTGEKSENSTWQLRCEILCKRFVFGGSQNNNECFLDRDLWKSGNIILSDAALHLFLGLERVIKSYQGHTCTAEIVFNSLSNIENHVILNYMRQLSRGFLTETQALDFLLYIIMSYSATSCKLEARLIIQKKQSTSSVSLRTNLKRNPKEKPTVDPSAEVHAPQPPKEIERPTTSRQTRSSSSVQPRPQRKPQDKRQTRK